MAADHITIKVDGIKELQNTFKLISKDILDIAAESIEDGGEVVKNSAVTHVHVVTGWLRSNIGILHVIKSENKVEVQVGVSLSKVPYAEKEEFRPGTLAGTPHAYIRPALDNNQAQIKSTIEQSISSRLRRYR